MCQIYDPPSVWREEKRVARRSHVCDECRRTIERGETYESSAGLSDGRWYGAKTCAHCCAARWWLLVVCDGYLIGGCMEDLAEHAVEYDLGALRVLSRQMANRWVDQRTGKRITVARVRAVTDWGLAQAKKYGLVHERGAA